MSRTAVTRVALASVLVAVVAPGVARADEPVAVHGWVRPRAGVVLRPEARERDRVALGAQGTSAGVRADGAPLPGWSFALHLVAQLAGEGEPPELLVDEATVRWSPAPVVAVVAGQQRIPLGAEHRSASTTLLFPARSAPTERFGPGTDPGVLGWFTPWAGRLELGLGVFGGQGGPDDLDEGLRLAARVDAAPLGRLGFGEAETTTRGPLRVGLGAGLVYRAGTRYDASGSTGADTRDLTASGSMRLRWRGAWAQAELLRRQRTDSLSSRPELTTGGHVAAAWTFAIAGAAVTPMARLGLTVEDQGFSPRELRWLEAGATFYPRADRADRLRVGLVYAGEHRVTEGERAHGVSATLHLGF